MKKFQKATSGGVFTGRQAVKLGLIDSIGSEKMLRMANETHKLIKHFKLLIFTSLKNQKKHSFQMYFLILQRIFSVFP